MRLPIGKEVAHNTHRYYIVWSRASRQNLPTPSISSISMKWHSYLLALSMLVPSCEKHAILQQEIATLEAAVKADQAAVSKYEQDIAALGGLSIEDKLKQQTAEAEARTLALDFDNAARQRKWSAIETEFAKLKPAAEAYKAAHAR
jgi:hypothetical protein